MSTLVADWTPVTDAADMRHVVDADLGEAWECRCGLCHAEAIYGFDPTWWDEGSADPEAAARAWCEWKHECVREAPDED